MWLTDWAIRFRLGQSGGQSRQAVQIFGTGGPFSSSPVLRMSKSHVASIASNAPPHSHQRHCGADARLGSGRQLGDLHSRAERKDRLRQRAGEQRGPGSSRRRRRQSADLGRRLSERHAGAGRRPSRSASSTATRTGLRTTPGSSTRPASGSMPTANTRSGSSICGPGNRPNSLPWPTARTAPSWSPDGTKIVYGSEGDLWVKGVAPGSTAGQLTNTVGITEERPVWSPDGETLYYNRGEPHQTARHLHEEPGHARGGRDPASSPAGAMTGSPRSPRTANGSASFAAPQSDGADLYTVNVSGTGVAPFATTSLVGDLNCVWSPDGTRILYTQGAFSAGELVTRGHQRQQSPMSSTR